MKTIVKTLALFLFLASANIMMAQKFGHINSQALLAELPEVKSANAQLEALQKQQQSKYESMVKAFQTKAQKYAQEAQTGTMTPVNQQKKQGELQKEQQSIQKFQVTSQQELIQKRESLFQPIVNRVNEKIRAVGKENGYDFIFDVTQGGVLFAKDSDDVTALVKGKL